MKYVLEIIAFVSGAVIMILELAGSRILAPYLGTSTFVWTSLIGIILASLSVGYYSGGKMADRNPTFQYLSAILFFSGILLILTAFLNAMVLSAIQTWITSIPLAAVVATSVLFAPPSVLLAMTVPLIVRLKIQDVHESGSTVGVLYSISTLGSITGTFLAGFFLLSYFGSTRILYVLSAAMLLSALLAKGFSLSRYFALLVFTTPFLWGARNITAMFETKNIADVDTDYNRVAIIDATERGTGKRMRIMKINDDSSSAAYRDSMDLAFQYTRYYLLADYFNRNVKRSLILGGGAYSVPQYYLRLSPHLQMDVIEIDPGLTELARSYFGLKDNSRLRIFHEDARTYLHRSPYKYGAVFVDVFKSLYSLPAHLTTVEAVKSIHNILEDDGIVIVNIISAIEGPAGAFLRAEYRTYRSVFPQVILYAVQNPNDGDAVQNIILVGLKKKQAVESDASTGSAEIAELLSHRWTRPISEDIPILTDELAPVELYSLRAIRHHRMKE